MPALLSKRSHQLGGLIFAKLRVGERNREFAGRLRDARGTLLNDLSNARTLVRRPLTEEELRAWRGYISQLARHFLSGRADVDPREYPATCERCRLQTLCRVHENPPVDADENGSEEEAGDA